MEKPKFSQFLIDKVAHWCAKKLNLQYSPKTTPIIDKVVKEETEEDSNNNKYEVINLDSSLDDSIEVVETCHKPPTKVVNEKTPPNYTNNSQTSPSQLRFHDDSLWMTSPQFVNPLLRRTIAIDNSVSPILPIPSIPYRCPFTHQSTPVGLQYPHAQIPGPNVVLFGEPSPKSNLNREAAVTLGKGRPVKLSPQPSSRSQSGSSTLDDDGPFRQFNQPSAGTYRNSRADVNSDVDSPIWTTIFPTPSSLKSYRELDNCSAVKNQVPIKPARLSYSSAWLLTQPSTSGGYRNSTAEIALDDDSPHRNEDCESLSSYSLKSDRDFLFDESNTFKKRRPINPTNFVSDDPVENSDLNDPEWIRIMRLGSDEERKRHAMRAFGNLEPADPTRNMSYHGFLRRQERKNVSFYVGYDKRDYTANSIRIRGGAIEFIADNSPTEWYKKRKASGEHAEAPLAKKRKILMETFKQQWGDVLVKYKQRTARKQDLKYVVKHWRYAVDEATSFLRYYDETNNNLVNEEELDKSECIEMMFFQFTNFYGPNVRAHCKECSHDEDRNVCHSL